MGYLWRQFPAAALLPLLAASACISPSVLNESRHRGGDSVERLGACFAADEVDDFVSNGASECDADWVNAAVTGGSVSTDLRTGLMWSRVSAASDFATERDQSLGGANNGYINWYEAMGLTRSGVACSNADHTDCNPTPNDYCGLMNSLAYGGHADWRPPGQKELMQAYIDGASHLADVIGGSGDRVWGNTAEADATSYGAYFRFGYGNNADYLKNQSDTTRYVRGLCVRDAGTAGIAELNGCVSDNEVDDSVDNGGDECDATWTNTAVTGGNVSKDHRTGLMWSRQSASGDLDADADGLLNWYKAVGEQTDGSGIACNTGDHGKCNTAGDSYCGLLNSQSYGGHTDWRAPGQKELMQAYVDGGTHLAALSAGGVFEYAAGTDWYWANTTESDDSAWGAVRRFGYGNGTFWEKNYQWGRAICVRFDGYE